MSDLISPVQLMWCGEGSFVPATPFQLKRCEEHFEDGKRYLLAEHQDRSTASHNHYFASVAEGWQQMPEKLADEFPTPEMLRKKALIATGYYDQRSIICASPAEAKRMAAFIAPLDDFAVVSVCGPAVVVRTAKSQSRKAMGGKAFNASKQSVLAWVSDLVGVDLATLTANTGRAA
jgi:hypothetical protein